MTNFASQSTLVEFLSTSQHRVNTQLQRCLDQLPEDQLREAMVYAVLNGGKRVRPALCYASAQLIDAVNPAVDCAAMAVEMIHAYSLVHDDLPAMDNDDLRRGKPTCHIAFNPATAILAGDALQSLAFEILAAPQQHSTCQLSLIRLLAEASGANGMVLGQAIDIAATRQNLSINELEKMHSYKTGALINASILMGAIATNKADDSQLAALAAYGKAIGLAFQVKDDILDVESTTATLGKRQGADEALEKSTYTRLLGVEGAKLKLAELNIAAHKALQPFGAKAQQLKLLADFVSHRSH